MKFLKNECSSKAQKIKHNDEKTQNNNRRGEGGV